MTQTSPPTWRLADVTLTPFSDLMGATNYAQVTAPSTNAWIAGFIRLMPVYLLEPFPVAKAFWCNGATVGTDSIDIGIYRMTDMTTGRLDLIRSTGAVLSAGTINVVQEASAWKVARKNLTSGNDSTDATAYTTASVTLKAGRLYCLGIENSHGSDAAVVSGIAGGPVWTSRATTQFTVGLNRVSLWTGVPTVDYTGTIVISFGATQTGAVWALDEMSGVDTTTTDGIVQTAVGSGLGVTSLATLAAFASANNATYGVGGSALNNAVAPGAGFTELADAGTATPPQRIQTEWQVGNDTTVDTTITSAAWGQIGAEIKADASPFVIPPSTPGNPAIYMAFTVSGTTAAIFRQAAATVAPARAAGYLELTSTFPLPTNLTPVAATTTSIRPLAGFSLRTLLG